MDGRSSVTISRWVLLGALLPTAAGCAVVPRNRLDDTQKVSRELRAELAEAKDTVAKLSTQNRDLAARSVEESRRNAALEEANERFERDILAYQEERERYATALDQIKSQVLAASESSHPTASRETMEHFLAGHPEIRYDAPRDRLILLPSDFFAADGAEPLPRAKADLESLARTLATSGWAARVVASPASEPILRASTPGLAPRVGLWEARAASVRAVLVAAGCGPDGPEPTGYVPPAPAPNPSDPRRPIAIELIPRPMPNTGP